MRINIKVNFNGDEMFHPFAAGGALEYLPKMLAMQSNVKDAFVAVNNALCNVNGGLGELTEAHEFLGDRIQYKEEKLNEQIIYKSQAIADFLSNALQTETKIIVKIQLKNIKFYKINKWARTADMRSLGENIKIAVKSAWKSTVKFVRGHSTEIKIVLAVVVVAALIALSIFTGGAAAVLFGMMAKGALTMMLVGGAMGAGFGLLSGGSFKQVTALMADGMLFGAIGGAAFGAGGYILAGGAAAGAGGYLAVNTAATLSQNVSAFAVRSLGSMLATFTGHVIDTAGTDKFMNAKFQNNFAISTALQMAGDLIGMGMAYKLTQTGITIPTLSKLSEKGIFKIVKDLGIKNAPAVSKTAAVKDAAVTTPVLKGTTPAVTGSKWKMPDLSKFMQKFKSNKPAPANVASAEGTEASIKNSVAYVEGSEAPIKNSVVYVEGTQASIKGNIAYVEGSEVSFGKIVDIYPDGTAVVREPGQGFKLPDLKEFFINDVTKTADGTTIKFNSMPWQNNPFILDSTRASGFRASGMQIAASYTIPTTGTVINHAYTSDGAANFLMGDTLNINFNYFKPVGNPVVFPDKINVPDINIPSDK